MILRLTQKLATKVHAGRLCERSLDENKFADWTCNLFVADRMQYIIMSNTASLYSCVMYARGVTDDSRLIGRVLDTIRDFTEHDGHASVYQRYIAPASELVTFAKSLNRSVTGSMNDLIKFAQHHLTEDDMSPFDVGLKLNGILLSALAAPTRPSYGKPSDAFKMQLESQQ